MSVISTRMDSERQREAGAVLLRAYGGLLRRQEERLPAAALRAPLLPVGLQARPQEDCSALQLTESDNKLLTKVLAALCSLCLQVDALEEQAKQEQYEWLGLYGELQEGVPGELAVAGSVSRLVGLSALVQRAHLLVAALAQQLQALYTNSHLLTSRGVRVGYMISRLGDLLQVLVQLETLVGCGELPAHWAQYCRAVALLAPDPALSRLLQTLQQRLMTDDIFSASLGQLRDYKAQLVQQQGLALAEEFSAFLRSRLQELERATQDVYESTSVRQWIKVNALFVFNYHVMGNADKKMFKLLCEVNTKAHSVPLSGFCVWHPEQFLLRHAPSLCVCVPRLPASLASQRQRALQASRASLPSHARNAQLQAARWGLKLRQAFSSKQHPDAEAITHRIELLERGVKFVSQIDYIVATYTHMHTEGGLPMTRSSLLAVCKLIEIAKGLQLVYSNYSPLISSTIDLYTQHLLFGVCTQLAAAKKTITANNKVGKQCLDELTALVIAERAVRGPSTLERLTVALVSLSLLPNINMPESQEPTHLPGLLQRAAAVAQLRADIECLGDCSSLHWHRSTISAYLQSITSSKVDPSRMRLLFGAFDDHSKAVERCSRGGSLPNVFDQEIEDRFNQEIVQPLGQRIETDLRLRVHSHLQLDSMNPFSVPVNDDSGLLTVPVFRFNDHFVSVSAGVEHYLSHTFYNLTTVVLHDWKTYGEMRQLAQLRHGLQPVQDCLPTQTLEQGLDVLHVMRNIHVLVADFHYNLNNQMFIQRHSDGRSLDTINIRHAANSIRTHGIGIMNTTVNFTYQFLRKKFHTFSQFMYDEQIKSRLIKDLRQFRESSAGGREGETVYSYKRADKFNKGIRRLGLDEQGRSYLDLFRILITHIGNALGYVRMVRSGGLHCCAEAAAFLPADLKVPHLLSQESEPLSQAAAALQTMADNLVSNFSQGTDYFKLLVEVFAPTFRNSENVHLKPFFMIVPPLTLNFVEHMLLSKDKLNKKNKQGAAFTDDGFAVGLAYILKLLDQERGMESLHWFEGVSEHIRQQRPPPEQQQQQQQHTLTSSKLQLLQQEFQLLYFSFSSATIFFQ